MQSKATTPAQYMAELPEDRKEAMKKLRKAIKDNLPKGFEEGMGYGMLNYVVPHSIFPPGYHCDPKQPLPFICLASQKNFISVYHMGLYTGTGLLEWFTREYSNRVPTKLDMGKCCIRLKNMNNIPYDLIGELASKLTPEQWIRHYQQSLDSTKKSKAV